MDRNRLLIVVVLLAASLLHDKALVAAQVYRLIHDLIQHNLAGSPVTHQKTSWNFDPEVGKQRRAQYERENGRYGEIAIARVGMGVGYKGPWGVPVAN